MTTPSLSLAGRVAVVAGTGPNIGAGIALALGAAGATVICIDKDERYATSCANDIIDSGANAEAWECDVTDDARIRELLATVWNSYGRCDALVNSAVTFDRRGLLDMDLEGWRRQLAVILDGAFVVTRATVELMLSQGSGAVVNVISSAGHQGEPYNIAYTTGKGGLQTFTRSIAQELGPRGIRVNSITPTATDPEEGMERARRWGLELNLQEQRERVTRLREIARMVPLGSLPSPSDYGAAVVYLCSDAANRITGADLKVDAGALSLFWAAGAFAPRDPGGERP